MENTFESKIQEISHRVNIIDVVSEHVKLKKSGSNWTGLCPFHNEKTPSFSVSPDKGLFYCFGCGVGGNIFTFLMKTRGITFSEALLELAKRAGVELPKRRFSPEQKKQKELKSKIYQINKLAEEFYKSMLRKEEGKIAIDYLKNERGLPDSAISSFRLGFAPDRWNGLVNFLIEQGIPLEDAERAGLVFRRKDSGYYDIFRNRIIFPITDMDGNIVGFGGRVIKSGEPKYLNSPETPVFVKGRTFYGMELTWREVRKQEEAFIVEGYFDLIMLYEKGIKNVLAPLGTALTEEHLHLLRGVAKRAYMLFDSDTAGLRAAERVLPLFLGSGIDASIVLLPAGDDPDTFIKREGKDALLELQKKAALLWEFYLKSMAERAGDFPEKKRKIIEEILSLLTKVSNPVTRATYIKQVGERFGVPEFDLNAVLKGLKNKNKVESPDQKGPAINPREKEFIYVMVKYPQGIDRLKGYIEMIEDERIRGLAKHISDDYINKINVTQDILLARLDNSGEEGLRNLLTEILSEFEGAIESSSALDRIVNDFESRNIDDSLRKLTVKLYELQKSGDEAEILQVLNMKNELNKKKQAFLKK